MNDIKPIQTEYKGYKFRSRLEARWAVFFDACGVDWEYEPEGYALGDGIYYLPDFLIRGCKDRWGEKIDLYVEVKGVMSLEDRKKIKLFNRPIIVVGAIPFGSNAAEMAEQSFDKWCEDSLFYSFEYVDGDYFGAFPGINLKGEFALFGADDSYLENMNYEKTEKSYKLARQARFEHGETPF